MHRSSQGWEDLKSLGRYVHQEADAVFGKQYESQLLASSEEFMGPDEGDFIGLRDADLRQAISQLDPMLPQPKTIPGQKGVPLLSDYYNPPEKWKSYFLPVHFETDEYIAKDRHDIESLQKLAQFLKEHPNMYLFIEGHCDERASASYNMALGMRRANFVRSFLVKQGIDMNRIYTSSRGKEQPLSLGHTPNDWKVNRRSEFKVYEKQ